MSSTQYGPDSIGYMHVIGEVENAGGGIAEYVRISLDLYDANNRLLATDFTYAEADTLSPGWKSPFEASFEPPAGYDHYSASVSGSPTDNPPNFNFDVEVTNEFVDSIGYRHVVGQVTNRNTTASSFVKVIGTFYDATGKVVAVDFTYVNAEPDATLQPGQTASFEMSFEDRGQPSQRRVFADSSSPPSPATPTPQPSPSASTSPTATVSPTPTPTYGPTQPSTQLVPRSANLSLSRHLRIRGSVTSTVQECVAGVPVKLQRRGGGRWRTLLYFFTNEEGNFSRRVPDRPGRYRVDLKRLIHESHDCVATSSAPVRHRH